MKWFKSPFCGKWQDGEDLPKTVKKVSQKWEGKSKSKWYLNSEKRGYKKDSLRGKLPKEEEASWPGETDHRKRPKYCCAWRGLLTKNFLRSLKCQSVCSIHDHRRLSHKTFIYFHYSTFYIVLFYISKSFGQPGYMLYKDGQGEDIEGRGIEHHIKYVLEQRENSKVRGIT